MEKNIGKYEIIKQLGSGSVGIVCKARDTQLNRTVAIKILKSISLGDTSNEKNSSYQRFLREAQLACRLRHPNIITIFDAGITELGAPYIVMEYVEGKDLGDIIDIRGALSPEETLLYLDPLARALDYAHSQSIVHRDIKPNNVVIDRQGNPFLLDFSVAKFHDTSLTPAGTLLGTPEYMAPEQFSSSKCDHSVDIFAFSVLAFEMLTGKIPFEGKDLMGTANSIVQGQPRTFADVNCPLPIEAQNILYKGLSKKPQDRFQKAIELVDRLRSVLLPNEQPPVPAYGSRLDLSIYPASSSNTKNASINEFPAAPQNPDFPLTDIHISAPVFKPSSTTRALQITIFSLGFFIISGAIYYIVSIVSSTDPNKQAFAMQPKTSDPDPSSALPNVIQLSDIELLTTINAQPTNTPLLRLAIPEIGKRNDETLFRKALTFSNYPDYNVKVEVLKVLSASPARIPEQDYLSLVYPLLSDPDHLVRGFAAKSLSVLRTDKAKALLKEQQLKETNYVVSSVIASELAKFK
ncbi:MAG: protein kinase [Deltaproteobacteria bacterium]|nr:protein kinase [Deltaproteobacteria bacterium]